MDVLRRLVRDGAINVSDDRLVERQRLAVTAVARWASGCLGHDDLEAGAYERRMLASFDGGDSAERVVSDIGSRVEFAGKPSLAGFASIVFAQVMDGIAAPSDAKARRQSGSTSVL